MIVHQAGKRRTRGMTLLEVLVAVALLGIVLGTVAAGLVAWHGQYRRAAAAWRCREVLGAVRTEAVAPQRPCGGDPKRVIRRGACRAAVGAVDDCRQVRVVLEVSGTGLRRTYSVTIPTEGVR